MAYPNLIHRHVAVSTSTNSELLQGLEAGTIDKTRPYMLTASRQTTGRGQHQRTWQSPKGNIYLSLYHPLTIPLSGLLSLLVGYHLTHLPIIHNINRLRKRLDMPTIGVKWVNDVGYYCDSHSIADGLENSEGNAEGGSEEYNQTYIQVEGQIESQVKGQLLAQPNPKAHKYELVEANPLIFNKLAGILIEPVTMNNQISGVVIGVGLNIETAPNLCHSSTNDMAYRAMSLHQIIEETLFYKTRYLDTLDSKQNNTDRDSDDLTGLRTSTLPSVNDLYLPISQTLLRAVDQFKNFHHTPHNIHQFINDYSSVNVLKGLKVSVQQSPSQPVISNSLSEPLEPLEPLEPSQPSQPPSHSTLPTLQTEPTYNLGLKGFVKGINADGSLKIEEIKNIKNDETTAVYSGTIQVIN